MRAISTRARISATSFINSYEWGDLKADPAQLMTRWFDLHLYLANGGTRRLMIRLPKGQVDRARLEDLVRQVAAATLLVTDDHVILDIRCEEIEAEAWDDGAGWLAALAPLRADLLAGDLRLLHLLWLTAVELGALDDDAREPLPGLGPLTPALDACARFFGVDPDLVEAAAERVAEPPFAELTTDAVRRAIAALPEAEKTGLLLRLFENPPHAAAELRAGLRMRLVRTDTAQSPAPRSAGELLARAAAIRAAREGAAAERAAAAKAREAKAAERALRLRLEALTQRGEAVWPEIERRNAAGYDRAFALLQDLRALAEQEGTVPGFGLRLAAIRARHARKGRFVERLMRLG
ncbi:MAG: hypothetical protein ACOYOH_26535 [Paracraurococcus sp.]